MLIPRSWRLQTKFLCALALASLFISAVLGAGFYFHMSNISEDEGREKARLVLSQVDAVQQFVRGTLRPRMYEALQDQFIIEAMSSSFISRAIMHDVGGGSVHHLYRRVAIGARNPSFEANPMERELIQHFRDHPNELEYQGYRVIDGIKHFVMARPVVFHTECLHCHGNPSVAPKELPPLYGNLGFNHEAGALDGLDFVGLPATRAVSRLRQSVMATAIVFCLAALFFFWSARMVFQRVVVNNVRSLTSLLRKIATDEKGEALTRKIERGDELDGMIGHVEELGNHLCKTRRQLQDYAANLEQKVRERTHDLAREAEERRADVDIFVSLLEVLTRSQSRADLWRWSLPRIAQRFNLERCSYVCTFASNLHHSWPDPEFSPQLPDDWQTLLTTPRGRVEQDRAFIPVESSEGNAEGLLCLYAKPGHDDLHKNQALLRAVGRQLGMALSNIIAVDGILRSKADLQSIFEGIEDPLVLVDSFSGVVIANQAARTLAKDLSDDPAGESHPSAMLCWEDSRDDVCRAVEWGRTVRREFRLENDRSFALSIYPVPGGVEGAKRAVVSMHETTAEKRLMALAAQSEKMATVGKLAAGLTHEINNPLGVILCYAELLRNSPQCKPHQDDLEVIIRHTRQARNVLQDLLHFARPKISMDTTLDLAEVISPVVDVFQVQAEKYHTAIQLHAPPAPCWVQIDPEIVEQIMANLLLNALDATPEQGGIVEVDLAHNGDDVLLTVRDNGFGIPEENLPHVWDPFFTTKEVNRGTGLGLTVVYGLMRDLGGSIDVCNHSDGGALFSLRFPAHTKQVQAGQEAQ